MERNSWDWNSNWRFMEHTKEYAIISDEIMRLISIWRLRTIRFLKQDDFDNIIPIFKKHETTIPIFSYYLKAYELEDDLINKNLLLDESIWVMFFVVLDIMNFELFKTLLGIIFDINTHLNWKTIWSWLSIPKPINTSLITMLMCLRIQKGYDINKLDEDWLNPIMMACLTVNVNIMNFIVNAPNLTIDYNITDKYWNSPLMLWLKTFECDLSWIYFSNEALFSRYMVFFVYNHERINFNAKNCEWDTAFTIARRLAERWKTFFDMYKQLLEIQPNHPFKLNWDIRLI